MRFAAATTLLFATLALASPAPIAQPEAEVAQPLDVIARDAAFIESIQLKARASKPKSGSGSSGGSDTNTSAAITLTPNRVLQAGALGLGVIEMVRLWG
ncbi:hypothetical protein J1614_011551 [Plenodomus biglobosus]|nr:hypothetical protein J1614_011551 [Plenodomus biglobosus]